jgi:uncharacterized protein (DUF952 family)
MDAAVLLHITPRNDWEGRPDAREYRAASLDSEGFIHCSTPGQVLKPANAFYRGQKELVLLCIDASKIAAPLRYEDCYESGEAYPHVYGALNADAVFSVVDFPAQDDGTFIMPPLPPLK